MACTVSAGDYADAAGVSVDNVVAEVAGCSIAAYYACSSFPLVPSRASSPLAPSGAGVACAPCLETRAMVQAQTQS